MNIINDKTFNLRNSLLNKDVVYESYSKVQANRSCQVDNFGRLSRILNLHMAYNTQGNFKRYF